MNETNRIILDTEWLLECGICNHLISPEEPKLIFGLDKPRGLQLYPRDFLAVHPACWQKPYGSD